MWLCIALHAGHAVLTGHAVHTAGHTGAKHHLCSSLGICSSDGVCLARTGLTHGQLEDWLEINWKIIFTL